MNSVAEIMTKNGGKEQRTRLLFCELQKAFDTLDNEILLIEIGEIGLLGSILEIIRNF